jgi:hypothetical protein
VELRRAEEAAEDGFKRVLRRKVPSGGGNGGGGGGGGRGGGGGGGGGSSLGYPKGGPSRYPGRPLPNPDISGLMKRRGVIFGTMKTTLDEVWER